MSKITLQITKNGKPFKQFKCPHKKFLAKHFLFVYNAAEKMKTEEEAVDIKVCVFTNQGSEAPDTQVPDTAAKVAPPPPPQPPQ